MGSNIRLNRALQEENERLRTRVEELQQENMRLFGAQADMQRLSEALRYQRAAGVPLQVADIVYPYFLQRNAEGAAENLVRAAFKQWKREENVIDDITCIVIFLDIKDKS